MRILWPAWRRYQGQPPELPGAPRALQRKMEHEALKRAKRAARPPARPPPPLPPRLARSAARLAGSSKSKSKSRPVRPSPTAFAPGSRLARPVAEATSYADGYAPW